MYTLRTDVIRYVDRWVVNCFARFRTFVYGYFPSSDAEQSSKKTRFPFPGNDRGRKNQNPGEKRRRPDALNK